MEKYIEIEDESFNIIKVDFKDKEVSVWNYEKDSFLEASENYLFLEKQAAKSSDFVVAFVSSSSVNNLKEAYPNYFADSKVFLENLNEIKKKYNFIRSSQASSISRLISRWLLLAGFNGRSN